ARANRFQRWFLCGARRRFGGRRRQVLSLDKGRGRKGSYCRRVLTFREHLWPGSCAEFRREILRAAACSAAERDRRRNEAERERTGRAAPFNPPETAQAARPARAAANRYENRHRRQ